MCFCKSPTNSLPFKQSAKLRLNIQLEKSPCTVIFPRLQRTASQTPLRNLCYAKYAIAIILFIRFRHQDVYLIFEAWKIINHNHPHNVIGDSVVCVNNPISRSDYCPCIGNLQIRIFLKSPVYSLTDNGDIALDGTTEHQIPLILCKLLWNILKERVNLINRSPHIKQIRLKMSVHRLSV